MKKTFLLLVLAVFCFAATVSAKQRFYVQPENVEQCKKQAFSAPSRDVVWTVWHADLIDWETLRPEKYDEIYARLSEDFFLSQFSLKRGFRLEPFFPLLFPKSPEALRAAAPDLQEKIAQVKQNVNQTLHEIHSEYFLLPLSLWCKEHQIPLEYEMRTEAFFPVAFLIQDVQIVRQIAVKNAGFSEALATSVSRQNGKLNLEDHPVVYPKDGIVLLVPDSASCGEVEKIQGTLDYLAEFQVPYATVTLGKNGPEAGFGAASWKEVHLMLPREQYSPECQTFLKRYEEFGGKVVK